VEKMPKKPEKKELKRRFILDSAAILNNFSFHFDRETQYLMTPEIVVEMRDLRSRMLVEQGFNDKLLEIVPASENSSQIVRERAKEFGLLKRLSQADISVIALAMDLKGKGYLVLTDDYTVQNLLEEFCIPYCSVLMEGIREKIKYEKECSNCGKPYHIETKRKKCDVCGEKIISKKKKLA
jgi:UPF0271 protein